ncbi:hypothetical protein BGZ82_011720 [Podila clonocystis]|nr:hypothetical protein BGZ82_011720 [Podila clonocystis]
MQATKFAHSSTVIYGSENGPREVEHPCRAIFHNTPSPIISYWINYFSYKDTTSAAKATDLRWKVSENRNIDYLSQLSALAVASAAALGTPVYAGTRE